MDEFDKRARNVMLVQYTDEGVCGCEIDYTCSNHRAIAYALRAALTEQREQICAIICEFCAGLVPNYGPAQFYSANQAAPNWNHQYHGSRHSHAICKAADIRARFGLAQPERTP